jgi:hypothetical protein
LNIITFVQVFFVKRGAFDPTSTAVIKRTIYFPTPVATDNFIIEVASGATPLVFKFDIIGMDPNKKYATDPMLTPVTYTDCKSTTTKLIHGQTLVNRTEPGQSFQL